MVIAEQRNQNHILAVGRIKISMILKVESPNDSEINSIRYSGSKSAFQNMKRFSTSLIREMQIKITIRFHLTPVRMAITEKLQINVAENVEKTEPLYTADGNVN